MVSTRRSKAIGWGTAVLALALGGPVGCSQWLEPLLVGSESVAGEGTDGGAPDTDMASDLGSRSDAGDFQEVLLDAHCLRMAEEFCAPLRCEPTFAEARVLGWRDFEECVDTHLAERPCGARLAMERGNLRVNLQTLEECQAVRTGCDDGDYASCAGAAFRPTGDAGEDCFLDLECRSGRCAGERHDPTNQYGCRWTAGRCAPLQPAGSHCDDTSDCEGLLVCDGVCRTPAVVGEACTPGGCESGARCVVVSGGEAICQALVARGGACEPEVTGSRGACADGLGCFPDSRTCEPLLGVGAECSGDDELCQSGACAPWGTCVSPAFRGEACNREQFCVGPLQCLEDRCRERSSDGCVYDGDCIAPLVCDAGVCTEPIARGDDCVAGGDRCGRLDRCEEEMCQPFWEVESCGN